MYITVYHHKLGEHVSCRGKCINLGIFCYLEDSTNIYYKKITHM